MIIGAHYQGSHRCTFRVWAPLRKQVAVQILTPAPRLVPMEAETGGYWSVTLEDIEPGTLYQFQLDGELTRPDPASQSQPQDVHGPSQVIDQSAYPWQDQDWPGIPLEDYVIYELHVGTFTPEGTFDAIIPRLSALKELGITAIEIMPVSQFPGDRNWGYDGVYPFAVQQSYGGVEGLKRLIDACHREGLAVVKDVVYNHFGPEGNYTRDFGPYFTDRYHTPWGSGINMDDAYSDGVRNFVIENALFWFRDFHVDALRLDAIHAIYDFGAKHILAEMKQAALQFAQSRFTPCYLIAESDLNDVRVINPLEKGGYGLDAQWSDDFHHCLHTLLTNEALGYYEDFGPPEQLVKAYQKGFVYDWQYSRSRKRYHGSDASDRPASQFVVCAQNHDQVGNRMLGERLSTLVSFEALKLAAGAVLLSPYIPLLFMGEEYGEIRPFLYFISHSDTNLLTAVREGRMREFAAFHDVGEPPDAVAVETFEKSKLQWELRHQGKHQTLWRLYQTLLRLRREEPALRNRERDALEAKCSEADGLIWLRRWGTEGSQLLTFMNFQPSPLTYTPVLDGRWQKCLDSADTAWMGPGSNTPDVLETAKTFQIPAQSFVLYKLTD